MEKQSAYRTSNSNVFCIIVHGKTTCGDHCSSVHKISPSFSGRLYSGVLAHDYIDELIIIYRIGLVQTVILYYMYNYVNNNNYLQTHVRRFST